MKKNILSTLFILSFLLSSHGQFNQEFVPAEIFTENDSLNSQAQDYYKDACKNINRNYKSSQASILKEKYKIRKEFFSELITDGDLMVNGPLYDYVKKMVRKICVSMNITKPIGVYLVRNDFPNAFNMGDDNIFIHTGLIHWANFKEEIAFVIGHELGHNELKHYDKKIIKYSEMILNDSIRKRIKYINRSDYGRVSKLNRLMAPWILGTRSDSRKAENDADKYGYDCLTKSQFNVENAIGLFDVFELQQRFKDSILFDFEELLNLDRIGSDFTTALTVKTGSSLGSLTKEEDPLDDLLRTHPFGAERKKVFERKIALVEKQVPQSVDMEFLDIKSVAEKEVIASLIYQNEIDVAMYYSLSLYRKDRNSIFAKKIIPFLFAYLGYEKIKRRAGRIIDTRSEKNQNSYNQTIYFLREISPNQCFNICKQWQIQHQSISYPNLMDISHLILDKVEKRHDSFKIRFAQEFDNKTHSYIKPIITNINNEK